MQPPRRDRMILDESQDPTRRTRHLVDPVVCPGCGATYIEGRWTWRHGPIDAKRLLCPACERTRDDYAAGFVSLRGAFALEHAEELIRTVRNVERREKAEHPIKRIIRAEERTDEVLISTTEPHLAQSIGRALRDAYKGSLDFDYQEDIVRVYWKRDE